MLGQIGKLLGHSAVYLASNFMQRGLSFLLLPLYAAYFTTAEFGAMDMLYQLAITLSLVTSLGLPQGLVRGFYLPGSAGNENGSILPEMEQRKLLGALVTFLVPISALATFLLLVFAGPLSRSLFQNEGNADWIRLAALLHLALVIQGLPLQLFKTRQRSRAYAAWSLGAFALIAGGNLYFIIVLKLGMPGMLLGNLLGVGATAVVLFALMLPKVNLNLEWSRLAPLFAFGLTMLPNLLSRKVLEVANRYMLPYWHGLSEVGLFSMGARVASIMDILLLVPFLYAWQPFFYSLAGNPEAPRIFARVTHYFLLLMATIFLVMEIVRLPVLHFLGRGKFDAAGPVISFLVLAAMFNGIQYCVSAGIHLRKKLVAEMGIIAAAACVNLLLNLLLIPRFGAAGAAAATAAAFFLYLAGSFVLAQRHYPVPYLWRRGATITGLALCAYAVLARWESAAIQIPVLLVFLICGPGWDLWRNGEFGQARDYALRRWQRMAARDLAPGTR